MEWAAAASFVIVATLAFPTGGLAQGASTGDLLAGTWHTDELTEDQVASAFTAAGGTASEGKAFFAQLGGGAREHAVIGLRFEDGAFTEYERGDNGADEVGYRASYRIGSDGTLAIGDPNCTGTYTVERSGDMLRLRLVTQCAGGDGPPSTTLFASFPFHRDTAAPTIAPLITAGSTVDYPSQSFVVPLTVTLTPALAPAADPDTHGLLSFDSASSANDKIRFLVPDVVLPPGTTRYVPPPTDMLAYLLDQADQGVVFSDRSEITVGGRPATLLSATTPVSIDDSIGCATLPDRSEACFGFLPEFKVRLAVIDLEDGTPLVAWARTSAELPNEAFLDLFERTLESVRLDSGR